MNNELKEKLNDYMELKNWIEEYNKKQMQKGIDLGGRIISDIATQFPYKIGTLSIDWWDNWTQDSLILQIRCPFDNNGHVDEKVIDYIVERYPDVKKHCAGVLLAKCIPLKKIDEFMKDLNKNGDDV